MVAGEAEVHDGVVAEVAVEAEGVVVADAAGQGVIAGAAVDDVLAGEALDLVIAAIAGQFVVAGTAPDDVAIIVAETVDVAGAQAEIFDVVRQEVSGGAEDGVVTLSEVLVN